MNRLLVSFSTLFLLALLSTTPPARAVSPSSAEQAEAKRFVAAKFKGKAERRSATGHLEVSLKGKLLKNMATTKVYHTDVGALPLRIVDKEYRRGLYCPSVGEIVVHLPSPAKRFEAIFGVDSNRVNSFYSNAGRGRVIGTVEFDGKELFRSKVMREGMRGAAVNVDLAGAMQFKLKMSDAGGGIVERVDFNQADWAEARVELLNGEEVWLGDLPTAPLRSDYAVDPPFSFRYDGRHSREFLKNWERTYASKDLDNARREHTLIWSDPATGLTVRCVGIEYQDFPVVEWKLHFKNTGDQPTPIIADIQSLDTQWERHNEGEFLLHHSNGSPHSLVKMSDPTDYAPRETQLDHGTEKRLESKIGLPASNDLPFFNLEWNGEGIIVAIGWPGQWAAQLTRDKDRGLHLQAGQQLTHFKLLPGEEVRSPLIAMLFWRDGDWLRAQNLWRRWMIAHNLPRTADGKLPPHQHAASSSAYYMEMSGGTEANQLMFINRYLEKGIKPDYWWIDAGWYDYDDYWLHVGTWRPNRQRFPRGLSPISDHLHKHNMKMILWFCPEMVARGSFIDKTHPEWLLKGGAEWWMGHAILQGEVAGHVNDSGLTLMEDVAAFGIGNPDSTITGKTRLADGKWHLITATRFINKEIGRSDLRLYVDGKLDASGSSRNTAPLDSNTSWGVGRQYQTRGIAGDIDDVRTYNSALTPEEVAALLLGSDNKPPFTRYSFDGVTKATVGTLDGERIGTGGPVYVEGVSRNAGDQALRFDNDYGVEIANQVPNDFTLSCWIKIDAAQPPPWGRGDFRLLDFGNLETVKWITDHVDQQINEQGVDLYRHDGIPPLSYWRANDAVDRQGISEIRHIEGLLSYWDELRRRHPMLRIDICSGGGSRNELETLRRAVPLWRSDYAYETTGMQTLTYGMSLWIPYFGTGINAADRYTFRSQMAPANNTSWDLRRRDSDYEFCRRMLAQRRQVTDDYYGDFYPLTTYRTENDVWMAWQFDLPEKGKGMVQAFRRPKSPAVAMKFKLRGLDPEARYSVKNFDQPGAVEMTGSELLEHGLLVSLPQPRDAALITYRRLE
jgi:alpha-galactosidase